MEEFCVNRVFMKLSQVQVKKLKKKETKDSLKFPLKSRIQNWIYLYYTDPHQNDTNSKP